MAATPTGSVTLAELASEPQLSRGKHGAARACCGMKCDPACPEPGVELVLNKQLPLSKPPSRPSAPLSVSFPSCVVGQQTSGCPMTRLLDVSELWGLSCPTSQPRSLLQRTPSQAPGAQVFWGSGGGLQEHHHSL